MCQSVPYCTNLSHGEAALQTVPHEALDQRTVRLCGLGICSACKGDKFRIAIYCDGGHELVCASCEAFWAPISQGSGEVPVVSQALGNGGNESIDLVPPSQRIAFRHDYYSPEKRRLYMRGYMREWRARQREKRDAGS